MAGIYVEELGLKPLKGWHEKKSLGQHVFENLKQAIVKGNIPEGKWLVETRIANMLDISRTPVREALHKLEREGLVRKLPRSGFTVSSMARDDIEETFGIRSVLEGYAARLAAIKHRKKELGPLEKKIEKFQVCLDKGQMSALPKINTEFHDLLYKMGRSQELIKMISMLGDRIYRFRELMLKDRQIAKVSNEDHRAILELIAKREAESVERLVREHIMRGQMAVLEHFFDS